jgi:hypothetical protein
MLNRTAEELRFWIPSGPRPAVAGQLECLRASHLGVQDMRGSCLCGQVEYEASQLASPIRHCSCRSCRKAHAAAFNTSASVKVADFKWLKGSELLKSFESSPGKRRYFCGSCGSHLVAQRAGSDSLALRVATLDDDPKQIPQSGIWTSHEVPWLQYGPQIASYAEWMPSHNDPHA